MAELIEIEVREDGSRVVQRNLEEVAKATEVVAASVNLMKSAINSIQGSIKQPVTSLQQMRAALQALQAVMKSPGAFFDSKVVEFASASLNRLKEVTSSFAKTAPANVQAAIGRIEAGIGAMEAQIQRAIRAQQALADAQKATARATAPATAPQQQGFAFMNQPQTLSGPGWQLEGQFKAVATGAKDAAGTIASLASPTQQFAAAATQASTSAQQLNLNLGAANQTSFAFMAGMQRQTAPVNAAAKQYQTVGQVWTQNAKQAQQLSFAFMNTGNAAAATGAKAAAAAGGVNSLGNSFFTLRNALYVLSSALFLRELKEYIDTWISIENSIKLSTHSHAEAAVVMDKVFASAQKTRMPVEDLTRLYRRLAQVQGTIGATQQEMIDVTEGVGMALAVQGTKIQDARGALLQLGQAFGMGRVRAQEFNSINENAPRILLGIARSIPEAHGSIERLRQLMLKGAISGRQFFEAFQKDLPRLRAEFEQVRPTIAQSFTVLDNAIGKFIYDTDKSVGVSTLFARSVIFLSEHLRGLAIAMGALAGIAIVGFWPTIVGWITKARIAMLGFNAAIASNPLGLLLVLLSTVTAAVVLFRDEISMSADGTVTLGDYMRAAWSGIARQIDKAKASIGGVIDSLGDLKNEKAEGFTSGLVRGFLTVFDVIKAHINAQIGTFVFLGDAVAIIFKNASILVKAYFTQLLNWLLDDISAWVNLALTGINLVRAALGKEAIVVDLKLNNDEVKTQAVDVFKALQSSLGDAFSKDYVGDFLSDLQAQANRFAMDRQLKNEHPLNLDAPEHTPGGESNNDKLQKELDRLRATVDPIGAAIKNLAEAEKVLDRAQAAGLVTMAEKNHLLGMTREHYQDIIHPYEALTEELQREAEFMGLTNEKRRAGLKTLQQENDLKKKGYYITQEEQAALYQLNLTNEHRKLVAAEEVKIDNELNDKRRALSIQQEALNNLLAQGAISMQDYSFALAKLKTEANMGGFGDAFITKLREMGGEVKNFAQESGAIMADFLNGFADGMSNVIAKSIVEWESFKQLFHDMAKQILTQLIAAFIRLGLQMALNAILGKALMTASVTASTAAASATATAWAPAAALASLATLGTNSTAATAALTGTYALAQGIATGSLVSLEEGGYTGDLSRHRVAGVVHGQEFVVNANATSRNRAALEAMNRGETVGGSTVNVTVQNYAPGVDIQTERISENEIRIIARQEAKGVVRTDAPRAVAADIHNPNGQVSKALRTSTKTERRLD